jgi:alanine-glyoxylate transaminase/serine-glyoxylate transaminase/serine-pyruvate transaminase
MTQAGGRAYRAIPGPSIIPDEVLQAMHRAAPNIYAGEVVELTESLIPDLKRVARTDGHVAIYICNGHGTWEASLANLVAPGERVLVPVTGLFGHSWTRLAQGLGIQTQVLDFGLNAPADPALIADVLKKDVKHEIKAILLTHVDTSTSVRANVKAIHDQIQALNHPALLIADCIASLGCDRFEMDEWGVDVAVTGSQKGLMTPPGLGFVFFNEKAAAVRKKLSQVSPYWDWSARVKPDLFYQYFAGTAPTHHLYGLRAALDLIRGEGIEAVWDRHEKLANAIWAACDAWGKDGSIALNIAEPDHRSRAVTTIKMAAPDATRLRHWVEAEMGLTLGIGLGMETEADPSGDGAFRIGHMGHVNGQMIMGVLGAIEAGLSALGIAHAPGGTAAAARVLGQKA